MGTKTITSVEQPQTTNVTPITVTETTVPINVEAIDLGPVERLFKAFTDKDIIITDMERQKSMAELSKALTESQTAAAIEQEKLAFEKAKYVKGVEISEKVRNAVLILGGVFLLARR